VKQKFSMENVFKKIAKIFFVDGLSGLKILKV